MMGVMEVRMGETGVVWSRKKHRTREARISVKRDTGEAAQKNRGGQV